MQRKDTPPGNLPTAMAVTPFATYARLPLDDADAQHVERQRRASIQLAVATRAVSDAARPWHSLQSTAHGHGAGGDIESGQIAPLRSTSRQRLVDESAPSHRSPDGAPAAASGARRASAGTDKLPLGNKRSKEAIDAFMRQAGNTRRPSQSSVDLNRGGQTRARASLESAFVRASVRGASLSMSRAPSMDSGQRTPELRQLTDALSATSQDIVDLNDIRRSFGGLPPPNRSLRVSSSMAPIERLSRPSVGEDEVRALHTFSATARTSAGVGSVRAQSDTLRRLRRSSTDGTSAGRATNHSPRRYAFGTGFGWATIGATDEGAADALMRNLAIQAERTEALTSLIPLAKMTPTIVGKMLAAFGVDVFTLGLSQGRHLFTGLGAASMSVGIVAVMLGMQALMYDMRRINPRRIPVTIAFSLMGMLLVSGSLILSETDLGARNLGARAAGAFIFGIGLTLLNTSLPLSFAYSEMVHGDTFRSYRNEAAFVLWGIGLGVATGLTVSRGAPHDKVQPKIFPFGVSHAFAVFGIACATFGTCLVATNLQRQTGLLMGLRTRVRQLGAEARGEQTEDAEN